MLNDKLKNMKLYIEVAKKKYQAIVESQPLKDKNVKFL